MYGMQNKRGRTESGTKSTQQEVDSRNAIVHYDANIAISVSSDLGVDDSLGYHGRFANFKETRQTALLPDTELYKVAVTRASVTTNDIPLFCPVPSGSGPVTENGIQKWEVTAQPGLNLTWTGPVFETSTQGFRPSTTNLVASWPNKGLIPFYTVLTNPSAYDLPVGEYPSRGVMDCASRSTSADCLITPVQFDVTRATGYESPSGLGLSVPLASSHFKVGQLVSVSLTSGVVISGIFQVLTFEAGGVVNVLRISGTTFASFASTAVVGTISANVDGLVGRLNLLFAGAGLSLTASVANAGLVNMTQFLQITNSGTRETVCLDFSTPIAATTLNYTTNTYTSKAGILQACKLLGFAPNTVASIGPGVTFTCPRAFQMGFRATIQLASYKTVRWVPEDAFNISQGYTPTVTDILNGTTRTYFDCYSYEHFLNQCVNPTFQRCIYDENDAGYVFENQCLTRQLQAVCKANCSTAPYSPNILVGPSGGISYNGRAYMWTGPVLESGNVPVSIPPNAFSIQSFWQDCGPSILQSYNPAQEYKTGDVITFQDFTGVFGDGTIGASCTFSYSATSASTGVPPTTSTTSPWSFISSNLRAGSLGHIPNVPTIGTAPPVITYNSSTQLFTLALDSYGFGGTELSNCDDGILTASGSPHVTQTPEQQLYNATLNDQARDSWGLTGTAYVTTPPYTTFRHPGVVFDERMLVECDDYFHQLFGNWPCQRLFYEDPNFKGRITSYVRYLPQVNSAGLSVPLPLPLFTPSTPSTTGYQPYERVKGNQPYFYTFAQDYSSVGGMWNPVDTLLFLTNDIPLIQDQTAPPNIISDTGPVALQQPNGGTQRILCEFSVQPFGNGHPGQQYRNEIIYEPQSPIFVGMDAAPLFVTVSWRLVMRMKQSQTYRPVSISDGGSVNMRLQFKLRGM